MRIGHRFDSDPCRINFQISPVWKSLCKHISHGKYIKLATFNKKAVRSLGTVILVVAKYYHNQYNNIHNTPMGIMDSCQPLDRNVRWFKAPWPLDQERVKLHAVTNLQRLVYESVYRTVREGLPESRDVS